MPDLITPDDLESALRDLDGWTLVDDGTAIEKEYLFKGFNAAFGFDRHITSKKRRERLGNRRH